MNVGHSVEILTTEITAFTHAEGSAIKCAPLF